MILVRDEDGVRGVDDDDVLQAEHCDEATVAPRERVAALLRDDIAVVGVAVAVLFCDFPQRRPTADVVPAD